MRISRVPDLPKYLSILPCGGLSSKVHADSSLEFIPELKSDLINLYGCVQDVCYLRRPCLSPCPATIESYVLCTVFREPIWIHIPLLALSPSMSTGAPLKSAFESQIRRHAGNVGEVETIAHAAQFCLESFDDCLVIAEDLGPKELALMQNQLGRLSLWISNIGVFALDRASTDYRLKDVPDTHLLVKGLVEVLNDNLQKCG